MRLKASATVGSAAVVLDSATGEVLRGALEGLTAAATMFPKVIRCAACFCSYGCPQASQCLGTAPDVGRCTCSGCMSGRLTQCRLSVVLAIVHCGMCEVHNA